MYLNTNTFKILKYKYNYKYFFVNVFEILSNTFWQSIWNTFQILLNTFLFATYEG